MFEMADSELVITDDALHEIARKALERDTGARALRGVVEEVMMDIMFHLPEPGRAGRYVITAAVVRGEAGAGPLRGEERRKESA
jgi:ATP-dependent Clp protease ATP-binding subunit ClpX